MGNFTNRNLDRKKLEESIPNIILGVLGKQYSYTFELKGKSHALTINYPSKPISLALYYRNNGLTSINPTVGQNQDFSNLIAQALVDISEISTVTNVNFSVPTISDNDFIAIIDLFSDSEKYKCSKTPVSNGTKFQITGSQNDIFTIIRYLSFT